MYPAWEVDTVINLALDLHYEDVEINMCVLLYKALQGESTIYINDLLITNKSVHGKETRHGQYNLLQAYAQSFDKSWSPKREGLLAS